MRILGSNIEKNIVLNNESDFKSDLGWSDNFKDFENETLEKVINPIENYETVRYIHKPYSGITTNPNDLQSDIWFYFYFLSGGTYVQDYQATGLSLLENAKMLKQSTESFFRLEFFKTTNNEPPERLNRRLVFAKNLTLPLGEQFYITKNDFYEKIFVPVFTGSNYKNSENMYFFWFNDDSSFNETSLTGTTFWMTAKYFNAKDGTILDFVNTCMGSNSEVVESRDVYYKLEIDRTDFSYQIYNYTGTTGSRVGDKSNPILFYEKGGGTCIPSTPTPTPMPTPMPTPTPTSTIGPTPTPTLVVEECNPVLGINVQGSDIGGQATVIVTITMTNNVTQDTNIDVYVVTDLVPQGTNITVSILSGTNVGIAEDQLPAFGLPTINSVCIVSVDNNTISCTGFNCVGYTCPCINSTPTPTPTLTATITAYYLQVRACHDINTILWTATPFTTDVLTYGQIFWSEGGFYYTVINASTTPQGGTLYGTRSYIYNNCSETPGYIP